ncbi:sigma factor-like helix-turn-helix DNA-binding protein [Pseudonocardia sp. CA-107938]|uniref:sigma factor-like helix-turn-helix DNA-binding protein n=1 Tax=Pseudonocardia sp. CA-107938 TaxID=3240021 RepID=UPI003D946BD9
MTNSRADDLAGLGKRLQRARSRLEEVKQEARTAVVAAAEDGMSESELARLLAVDRMTIRSWLGKGRSSLG